MALVDRYFSTTAAGTGDGTSWANRAALLSAGSYSSVITSFDFSLGDGLRCLIGPGEYAPTQSLSNGILTNTPTSTNQLMLVAVLDGGDLWEPPDPGWMSSMPEWDSSLCPIIRQATASAATVNSSNTAIRGLVIGPATAFTSNTPVNVVSIDWCKFVLSGSFAGSCSGMSGSRITNCCAKSPEEGYLSLYSLGSGQYAFNCRAEGSGVGSVGVGFGHSGSGARYFSHCTSYNSPGGGFAHSNAFNNARLNLYRCTSYGAGGAGVRTIANGALDPHVVNNCMIVNNGTYGVEMTSTATIVANNNRLRDNTSGNFVGFGNWPTDQRNLVGAGTDADEFVDAAGGDLRIKNTSDLWGKGIGAGDQPAAGGGASTHTFFG